MFDMDGIDDFYDLHEKDLTAQGVHEGHVDANPTDPEKKLNYE